MASRERADHHIILLGTELLGRLTGGTPFFGLPVSYGFTVSFRDFLMYLFFQLCKGVMQEKPAIDLGEGGGVRGRLVR